jgi:hypothetical protein
MWCVQTLVSLCIYEPKQGIIIKLKKNKITIFKKLIQLKMQFQIMVVVLSSRNRFEKLLFQVRLTYSFVIIFFYPHSYYFVTHKTTA